MRDDKMSDTIDSQEPSHRKTTWMRGLHMLVVLLLVNLAGTVQAVVALIQFFWMLFKEEKNAEIARFGRGLGRWFAQATAFVTGSSEDKPFPYQSWPSDAA
jgi:flagellar basal body-associated protein FliL